MAAKTKSPDPAPVPKDLEEEVAAVKETEKSALQEAKDGALSLIDEETGEVLAPKKKAGAPRIKEGGVTNVLPPISRIRSKAEAAKQARKPVAAAPPPDIEEVDGDGDGDGDTDEEVDEKIIHIKPPIIVRVLAERLNIKPFKILADLMELEVFTDTEGTLEPDVASALCEKHGFVFEKEKRAKGAGVHKVEEVVVEPPPPEEVVEEELSYRAPIITFMGHVDHGKTSLLDFIRKAKVADGEAGGITQHIGAYTVKRDGKSITFVDTPGHAAFTEMRARGANVTDIVVLVVAADDGMMPQTIEALNHARAAGVTIIVAINKIDLPSANIDRVKKQLQDHDLAPEDWGGDTICCEVSAIKGTGIDALLDMMLLQAEVLELKANPQGPARATVIEARMEPGRGPTATAIIDGGTLKLGKPFICGPYWGKAKSLTDDAGKSIKKAGPAQPVEVFGFSGLPNVGDEIVEMDVERAAKKLSEERLEERRTEKLVKPKKATMEDFFEHMAQGEKSSLKLVIRCDVQGSAEAIVGALRDIPSDKVRLEILQSAAGPIVESDILLSSASDAIIIGFNTRVDSKAVPIAKREGVQIKLYSIIYELIDQVREAMAGLLEPEVREKVVGHAEVRQVFKVAKGRAAGCIVTDGRIVRKARARVLRGKQPVYDGGMGTLRRFQNEVAEVRHGVECGIRLGDFNDYEEKDIIECYELEKFAQSL